MVKRFAIKIAYIGSGFHGFQRQTEEIKTIEGSIFETLQELGIIDKVSEARYSAAGRTDQGVNAIEQIISFDSLRDEIHLEELNQHFPESIYAWALAEVGPEFNARRDAVRRTYRYFHPYQKENLQLIKKALKKLGGTHDFIRLCKRPDKRPNGSLVKTTILTLDSAKATLLKNKQILQFEFTSKSFLWKQVRKMVSLVLAIGARAFPVNIVDVILNPSSNDELKGGIKAAPPEGLVLYKVEYENVKFRTINKKSLVESRLIRVLNFHKSTLAVLEQMEDVLLS